MFLIILYVCICSPLLESRKILEHVSSFKNGTNNVIWSKTQQSKKWKEEELSR